MKKLLCLAAFLLLAAQIGSADIFFQPQNTTVMVGDTFAVDVMISGVVAPWLAAYDMDVTYQNGLIALLSVQWHDTFLGAYGTQSLPDATFSSGMVNVAEISLASTADLGALQSGHDPFRLYTLRFSAEAAGVSPLRFSRVELADGDGGWMTAGSTPDGSITVTGGSVPEPGAFLMFLVPAGSTLAILRRRRSR